MDKQNVDELIKTEESMASEIDDPRQAARIIKAIEIMKLHTEDGMSIEAACAKAGVSKSTYLRWVKAGIFAPIIQTWMTPIVQDMNKSIMEALPTIIERRIKQATGKLNGATMIDEMNASNFIMKFIDPYLVSMRPQVDPPKEDDDDAKKFLEERPDWAKKLGPGDKIKRTTTETVELESNTIDVTPDENLP